MPHVRKNMRKSYSATTGTGSYTLGAAVPGYTGIAATLTDGDTGVFTIRGSNSVGAAAWETIRGTYTASDTVLVRTEVLDSSTGSAINWGTGNKTVSLVDAAERTIALDMAGTGVVGLPTDLTLTGLTGTLTLPGSLNVVGNATLGDAAADSHTVQGTMTLMTAAEILLDDSITTAGAALPLAFDGDADTGLFRPAANTLAVAVGGVERLRVASNGTITLGAAPNSESVRILLVTNSVNSITFGGGATGNSPYVSFGGTDTNVGGLFYTRGTGAFSFITNSNATAATQVQINHTASTNRWITLTGSNGGAPTIGTSGGDLQLAANTGIVRFSMVSSSRTDGMFGYAGSTLIFQFSRQANGLGCISFDDHVFYTGAGGTIAAGTAQVRIANVGSAVNILELRGAATGGNVSLTAAGSDTNIGITLANKGTAVLALTGQTVGTTSPSAGGAGALPATPAGYVTMSINGTNRQIPYY